MPNDAAPTAVPTVILDSADAGDSIGPKGSESPASGISDGNPSGQGASDASSSQGADQSSAATAKPDDKAKPKTPEEREAELTAKEEKLESALLEVDRRGRDIGRREKSLQAREESLKQREKTVADVKTFLTLAKTQPIKFLQEICGYAGVSHQVAIDALLAKQSGANLELDPAERVARLEREREEERAERAKRDRDEAERREREEDERTIASVKSDLRSLAEAAADRMPFINDDLDGAIEEAAELMIRSHVAAQKEPRKYKALSKAKALQIIEETKRADFENRAQRRGLKPAASTQQQTTPTASNGTPRPGPAAHANVAVPQYESGIRSDEEIANDWNQSVIIPLR